jgi:hypothetical protein
MFLAFGLVFGYFRAAFGKYSFHALIFDFSALTLGDA